ncbi:mitochondrial carrier domain-containing protein [Ochromonadaceae sp. CCMP2298]|nr:mitochondrial carrier domain-containing protein [Ochromonadaceae sp. CCMP2298]|mmetsp:Transcript_22886/g.50877  ORF Transcript_22886/g.50877 Transcript_22886/m.50877 type:complete len:300 (-) Transcript_22886:148-1047(-)|eukprot:CAMPEP_0173180972 /NCGR_PEP_ID=MMETSP1141-20130122/7022_1 /TAXON_ID=483371 /ORGANISM="non described non described, Strain CCMP2298" /LENGTH=299 /DNA_ID=CAMNT_0014103901 /DNA_START=101 /DNA_END=1000 /DNA_ORIENTATION=+
MSADAPTPVAPKKREIDTQAILKKALQRAGQGGLAGAAAMGINVCSLMWMRTTINYQYRYGTSTMVAFKTLYADGGIPRFYRGLIPALLQGPLSRFGDTAANTGVLAALEAFESTESLPVAAKTVAASVGAALFRILLMPIDTVKTTMQVEGKDGLSKLMTKFKANGPSTFFQGALAASAATFVGHYPWFFVYNYLSATLPKYEDTPRKLGRAAVIGFCASAISDTCSNSIRVLKVYKQANTTKISYGDALKAVIKEDGVAGLFGRGLQTKIIANGMQGLMFSVLWKLIDEKMFPKEKK